MPVKDADPQATELDAAFAAAMEGTPKPREVPSPPDIDPDAPHGRGEDGQPLAPYGLTKDGKPKRTSAGRKPSEAPRVAKPGDPKPEGKADPKPKPALEQKDFTGPLAETSEAIWVGLTFCSMAPLGKIPLISSLPIGKDKRTGQPRKLGSLLDGLGDKIGAQAAIFNHNRGALVGALNIAANNSPKARRFAEWLETGDATWVLMCGAMLMPFISQSGSLWSGTLEEDELPPVEKLAANNKAQFDGWIERFNAQLAMAAEAAAMNMNGQSAEAA